MASHHHHLLLLIMFILVALATTRASLVPESSSSTMDDHLQADPWSRCDRVARWRKNVDPHCSTSPGNSTKKIARKLQQRDRYITYQALRANSIPCGWKGNSYYDCSYRIRANPYTRGCTEATRCFRYTH
ncbi:unnamed protein product [Linum tenue]|uniref:Uncharacterized protein n=1 Tax=Linum tenue TaxID=586396 RepID=A0AAV0PCH7_9ROSI|nr:unnamed protein product [Linum tenue]